MNETGELLGKELGKNKHEMYELLQEIVERRPVFRRCSYRLNVSLDKAEKLIRRLQANALG